MVSIKKSLFILSVLCFFAFVKNNLQKKIIYSTDYSFEFYVLVDKKEDRVAKNAQLYWFKGGEIHSTDYISGGYLLHDIFMKFYRSDQLAERGTFDYGLKKGIWTEWYKTGAIKKQMEWKKGYKDGIYIEFDSTGTKIVEGNFNKNLKHGEWIDFRTGDTIHYKLGTLLTPKTDKKTISEKKLSFIKRLFGKKDSITDTNRKAKNTINSKKNNSSKKGNQSFFKRLFGSKKDSLPTANETLINPDNAKTKKKKTDPKEKKQSFFKKLFGSKKDEKQKAKK